jgi:hypothetical protein
MSAHHDLKLTTALSYENVEQILTSCCSKLYSMTLDGIEESKSGIRKVIRISFEDPADRERFRHSFKKTRSIKPLSNTRRPKAPFPAPFKPGV